MGALYRIFGDADDGEVRSMGQRLAHRGDFVSEWSSLPPWLRDRRPFRRSPVFPDNLKIHGRTQKYIVRKACAGLLPEDILSSGKSFNRLKHDLQLSAVLDQLADELLSPAVVSGRGLFEPPYVSALGRSSASKAYPRERAYRLWSLLLTEIWSRLYLDGRGVPPRRGSP